jgi:molybdate transport system regulatory protein
MSTSRSRIRVSGNLRLEMRQGGLANPRWMALLGNIENSRSITAAAKAAGLSYKAAWDAIDAMNNLAGKPVVATAVGGKGGGGARLTAHGRELLATYRVIEVENEHFVAAMNARLGHAARGVEILGRLSMRTSARNQWAGKVSRLRRGAVNDEVEIKLAGGERIVAVITHESRENLGLEVGSEAFALVKASSVIVGRGSGVRLRLSARNQLAGKITRMTPGAVSTEVVIGLRGSHTVAAVITNASAQDLDLKVGQKALAIIKASSVVLATA